MTRPADESERKHFYKLTRVGRSALTAETERLSSLVHVARARIKPRAGGLHDRRAASVLLLMGLSAAANWLPARRAARADPLTALRTE